MDDLTRQISEFASKLDYEQIPADTIHLVKQHVMDSLSCAYGGRDCDAVRVAMLIGEGTSRYPGRVLTHAAKVTAETAAFANSSMIRYLDFNDAVSAWGHPSDNIGGILAIAEAAGVDGKRFLTAVMVAYEVSLRLGEGTKFRQRGWDQGFFAAVGTAAAVCHMYGLPTEKIAHAVSMTATANVQLRASRSGRLSHWKGSATAYAVRNGVFSALLAKEGITGPDRPFDGRHGLFEQATNGPFSLAAFPTEGGKSYINQVHLKYWPVESSAQIAIFGALELRRKIKVEQISEIMIDTSAASWQEIGSEPEKWDPTTRETADHSLPYIFAKALVDGTITVSSFEDKSYLDPALRPLMARIKVRADDRMTALAPNGSIRIKIVGTNGESHVFEQGDPRGHVNNPMNDEEISWKFHTTADPVIGNAQADEVLKTWWAIGSAPNLTPALDLLVPQ